MMQIVYRGVEDIHVNPKNPRLDPTPDELDTFARSLERNGTLFEARPILLSDRTGELVIVGGEKRFKAALKLGMDTVPTILIHGLTEAQEDEILIKDNTHVGKWDSARLEQWDRGQLESWGVSPKDLRWEPLDSNTPGGEDAPGKLGGVPLERDGDSPDGDDVPVELDMEPREKPYVVKLTFPDAGTMTRFVQVYGDSLGEDFGCTMSMSGGEL